MPTVLGTIKLDRAKRHFDTHGQPRRPRDRIMGPLQAHNNEFEELRKMFAGALVGLEFVPRERDRAPPDVGAPPKEGPRQMRSPPRWALTSTIPTSTTTRNCWRHLRQPHLTTCSFRERPPTSEFWVWDANTEIPTGRVNFAEDLPVGGEARSGMGDERIAGPERSIPRCLTGVHLTNYGAGASSAILRASRYNTKCAPAADASIVSF